LADERDYMKLESFFTRKEIISKLNRLSTESEKIFARYTLDKGLITRIYRELKNLNPLGQAPSYSGGRD
jgi:hypothetical protein